VAKRKCNRLAVALLLYGLGVDADTVAQILGLSKSTVKTYVGKYAKRLERAGTPQQMWQQIQQILTLAGAPATQRVAPYRPEQQAGAPVQGQPAQPRTQAPEAAVPPAIANNAWVELIRSRQA